MSRSLNAGWLALALGAWVLSGCALRAEEALPGTASSGPAVTPSAPAPAPEGGAFFLIVDYLPLALYEDEPLTACFRIENTTGKDAEVEVAAEFLDEGERELRTVSQKLTATAARMVCWQTQQELAGVGHIRFALATPKGKLPGPRLKILRDKEAWPAVTPGGRRLFVANTDEALLPVAQKHLHVAQRKWAPLVWLFGPSTHAVSSRPSVQVMLPADWVSGDATAFLPESARQTQIATLGPFPMGGAPPILRTVGAALTALANPVPERLVLALPPEDLDVATDPRAYRVLLDTLIARLKAAGVQDLVVLPPFRFNLTEAAQKGLWTQAQEATLAQESRWLAPGEFLDEQLWRLDPAVRGVYGPRPNAEGRKKIAQKLATLIP